jgi:nicotinate-nucleotide adenylyltransferase
MAAPEGVRPSRLGVFGGTFDPPHVGHVAVAGDVARHLSLDRLIWMPAGEPPHKPLEGLTPAPLRLEMTRAAAGGEPRFEVSELEIRRPGRSYTVDTLQALRDRHGEAALFLVLGADELGTFATGWRAPEVILRLATLAVMDRAGASTASVDSDLSGMERTVHVPVRRVDVSSTGIRALVREGRDVSALVPPGVLAIMEREGLYRG